LMAIEKDGYRLIWKLLGKKDRATGETALASASARVSKANEAGSGTGAELDRLNGEVRYDDFVPGCDLQYVVTPTGVKENIIVREKKEAYIFDFLLKTKNLNLELSEDGRKLLAFVERVDETTGAAQKEVIFDIPAPYMIDGAGNEGYDVTYELSRQRNGKYLFSIVADETWINAEGRVFPVTIDPAIETGKNKNLEIMAYQTGTLTADMRYHYSCGHGFGSHHSGCAYLLFRFSIDHEDRLIQSVKLNLHCGSVAYNGDYKGYEVRPIVSKEDWMFFVTSDFDNNPPVAGEEVIYCFDKKLKAKEWLELDLTKNYADCGAALYYEKQKTYQGGSGAACSAIVANGIVLDNLRKGQMKNVLLIGTGALMSPLTAFQGESIPSIAHCIEICAENIDSEGTQNAVADIS